MNFNLPGKYELTTKQIGYGGFAEVFRLFDLTEKRYFDSDDDDDINNNNKTKLMRQISEEAKILAELKHSHIVQYYESFYDDSFFFIIMEYCEPGNLEDYYKKRSKNGQKIEEEIIIKWLKQLASSLKYVHEKKIIHRDIKPMNILIDIHEDVKLADFGIAVIYKATFKTGSSSFGSYGYQAPEVLSEEPYCFKCDIWALGITIFELCEYKVPFGNNVKDILFKACPNLPVKYSDKLNNLIKKLLDKDQLLRYSATEIENYIGINFDYENIINKAIQSEKEGRYLEAINFYDQAIEIKPDAYEIINMKGIALQGNYNYKDAIVAHEKSIKLKPDFYEAWYYKAYALYNIIKSDQQNKAFTDTQAEKKPIYLFEAIGRENVLRRNGILKINKYEDVIAAYENSLNLNPKYVKALSLKAQILHELGCYKDAIQIYDQVLQIKPDDSEAIINKERSKNRIIETPNHLKNSEKP